MTKVSASVRLDAEDHARASMVALVDRRSVSEIIAECVKRALPAMLAEMEQPRLTPEMRARIEAGEPAAAVLLSRFSPYAQPSAVAAILRDAPATTPPKPTPPAPTKRKRGSAGDRFDLT